MKKNNLGNATSVRDNDSKHRQVLRDDAYSAIIAGVSERKFRPGRLLSQREISEATGCTITAVREALKRLEGEKVVELIPQKGIILREIGRKEIEDIYNARKQIEIPAIRAYCESADRAEIASFLEQTHEILAANSSSPEEQAAINLARGRLDRRLHRAFVAAFDNEILSDFLTQIETRLLVVRAQLPALYSDQGAAFEEHLEILAALREGNADQAADALDRHLTLAKERALQSAEF